MRFGKKLIPVLIELLADRQAKVREAAARSLDRVPEAFTQLSQIHNDRSRHVRSAAASSILRLSGVPIEEQIQALALFLYDREGRPIDCEQGSVTYFEDGVERPYMLSEAIFDLEHPLAEQVLERWKAHGGVAKDFSRVSDYQ